MVHEVCRDAEQRRAARMARREHQRVWNERIEAVQSAALLMLPFLMMWLVCSVLSWAHVLGWL